MSNDAMFKTMLDTIIASQEQMATEVREIKTSMIEIVRIEERQANQKEAISRIGKSVDRLTEKVELMEDENARCSAQYNSIAARVTMIAGGIATVVSGVILMLVQYLFNK